MRSDDATTLGDAAFNLALQHMRDKGMPHMAEAVRDICVENETLHARIATLAAEVERVKEYADSATGNLILQTICRLPSVLTTDDWQDYLDEHRHEWLNDDRAFGGWVSQRLSVAIATARADVLREVREKVDGLLIVDTAYRDALAEALATLDAPRGAA